MITPKATVSSKEAFLKIHPQNKPFINNNNYKKAKVLQP